MDILLYILIFAGIFGFLSLGMYFLLKSQDNKKKQLKKIEMQKKEIEKINDELDDTLELLEQFNEPMEQIAGFFDKINNQFFKVKIFY